MSNNSYDTSLRAVWQEWYTGLVMDSIVLKTTPFFLTLGIVASLCVALPYSANAKEGSTAAVADTAETTKNSVTASISQAAGVDPASFFYWFDILLERISIWIASGATEEIPRLLELADEKIAEAAKLAPYNPASAAEASEQYERYLKEAVSKSEKANEKGEDVDVLLTEIADSSIGHIGSLLDIASENDLTQYPYVEEALVVIENQEQELLNLFNSEEKRTEAIQSLFSFLELQREKIPPEYKEQFLALLNSFIGTLSSYLFDIGGEVFETVSGAVKEYAKDQANEQLDKVKESVIEKIQEVEIK